MAAWESTVAALVVLGHGCRDEDFDRPTDCPGWTVKDQFSHVIGIERTLLGEPEPDPGSIQDLPTEHVRNDLGRRNEVAVHLWRPVPGPEVVAELEQVLARRLTDLRSGRHRADEPTVTPIGIQMPLVQALSLRTFDCWTHEQDVREALDRPGNLDSPAAQVAIGWMRRRLPVLVARDAGVPIDRIVVVQVHGPVGFLTAVRVDRADDARPVGVVLDPSDLSRPADTTLRLTTRSFARRCCGRWTPERTGAEITGAQQLGRAVLAALSIAP